MKHVLLKLISSSSTCTEVLDTSKVPGISKGPWQGHMVIILLIAFVPNNHQQVGFGKVIRREVEYSDSVTHKATFRACPLHHSKLHNMKQEVSSQTLITCLILDRTYNLHSDSRQVVLTPGSSTLSDVMAMRRRSALARDSTWTTSLGIGLTPPFAQSMLVQ